MKKITFFLLLIQNFVWAQDFSRDWVSHFSYNNIVTTTNTDTKIYAAANNSIFVHSLQDNVNRQFTTVEGLSAQDIVIIRFIENRGLIVVGFANGLVNIINEETGEINSLNDISSVTGFPPDAIRINDIFESDGILYIATGFGIVEYSLELNAFRNTFLISDSLAQISNVVAVGVLGDFIFASIEGRGTFVGNRRDRNLILFSNWNLIQPDVFSEYQLFSGRLISRSENTNIYEFNNTSFEVVYTDSEPIVDFSVSNNALNVTTADKLSILNGRFESVNEVNYPESIANEISNSFILNNVLYFSQEGEGLLRSNNLDFNDGVNIAPNGPLTNSGYAIDISEGDLWLTYGRVNELYAPLRNEAGGFLNAELGVSRLRGGQWSNVPFEDFNALRILDVLIDPNDREHVFFGSYDRGLLEYNNGEFSIFDEANSNIEGAAVGLPGTPLVFALNFDNEGDLWYVNSFVDRPLKEFTNNEVSENQPDLTSFFSGFLSNGEEIVVNERGNIFMATILSGIVGFNPNTKQMVNLVDEIELTNIPSGGVRALALDNEGELWMGTGRGLRVIRDPDEIFEESEIQFQAESIIFIEDGTPQELLFEQFVTDIVVDAENNKWVSTLNAGVFQFSPDGQETLRQFTTENSPLPSNDVEKIAIDDLTGNVFFVTSNGLMEFKSNIVRASENLDNLKIFPNPVRPEFKEVTVRIEGLTAGANVKITDIEGNLVFEDQNSVINGEGSGLIEWDTRSFSGRKVASGVYLVLVTSEDQSQTKVGKLLIVR